MITRKQAQEMRKIIEAHNSVLTDEETAKAPFFLCPWNGEEVVYHIGDRVQYGGSAYKCVSGHTSQAAWTPTDAPSLWAKILIPDPEVIPEWEQPESTNPYMKGDKVRHNGKVWVSDVDNNVWEPGIFGWSETEEG